MPPAAHHRDGSTKEVGKVCFFCYFLRLKLGNDYLDIKPSLLCACRACMLASMVRINLVVSPCIFSYSI